MAEVSKNYSLQDILALYNSITPSRTRWVRNRNELKNKWKELFQILEKASGRDGNKIVVFDAKWHEYTSKGHAVGAVNRASMQQSAWTPKNLPVDPIDDLEFTPVKKKSSK